MSILEIEDVHRGTVKIDIAAGGVVLVDLDGTTADLTWRRPFITVPEGEKKDWKRFKEGYLKDPPIPHVIEAVRTLYDSGHWTVFVVTGREGDEQGRRDTLLWLAREDLPYHGFYQRAAGDYRPDDEVKKDILDEIRASGVEPTLALDDRDRVVAMWRENGIMCVQVAEGDF